MDHDSLKLYYSGLTMLSRGRKLRNILDVLEAHKVKHPDRHTYLDVTKASGDGENGNSSKDGESGKSGEDGDDGEGGEGGEGGEDSGANSSDDDSDSDWSNAPEDGIVDEEHTSDDGVNDDKIDGAPADDEDASPAAKVDTQMVYKDLDVPEMAALIYQVCEERKQPARELTVVHYVAVEKIIPLDNLCNAIELSDAELPCRHVIVQQIIEGETLLPNNTSRVSAMLQFLFRMYENDVVIFEHVHFDVGDINVHDNVINASTPLGTLVEMKGEEYTLLKLSTKKNKFSLEKDGTQLKNGSMYAFADLTIVKKPADNLDPDDYRSLAYTFNGEHNQLKQQEYLSTRGDIIMCNAVVKEFEGGQNVENWRGEWTAMKENGKHENFDKWNDWGRVQDYYDRRAKDVHCLLVQTLNNALPSSDSADNFLYNVIYGNEEDIPVENAIREVELNIEDKLLRYDKLLRPSVQRFVSEFKDVCPSFQDAVYEIDGYDNYGKEITVSFADYRDTVSVLKKFLDKKLLAESQWEASFLESYMLQDNMNRPKFDLNNDNHVKSFILMCYKKAAWFKSNHQRLLQARYVLWCCIKNNSKLKSWAKWMLFVVEQIIVMSNFARSATLDRNLDAEKTIAFKQIMDGPERKLLRDFRKALLETPNALFPTAEGEVFSAMGAFRSIEAGLKGELKLLQRIKFQVGNTRKKPRKKKADRTPKPKESKRSRGKNVMRMKDVDVFNMDGRPTGTSKKRKKGKKSKRKKGKKKKKRAK